MNLQHALTVAGVPDHLHAEALDCLEGAEQRAKGLLLAKLKVRLLKAGKIARLLPWGAERLVDVRPDLADWDIAPMVNITAHGDNGPWEGDPGRPVAGYWLNPDPESAEYREAVAANYWCPGEHPRSRKSRKTWYRRNGGEFLAWRRGLPVMATTAPVVWTGQQGDLWVKVCRSNDLWIVITQRRVVCSWGLKTRHGYEIDNVFGGQYAPQLWYPAPGFELRAPVAWSTVPGKLETPA